MLSMELFFLFLLSFYIGNSVLCFKLETRDGKVKNPGFEVPKLLHLADVSKKAKTSSVGVSELYTKYARQLYRDISLHDDDDSVIDRIDGQKRNLISVEFIQGYKNNDEVLEFDTTHLPKDFVVSYAEIVTSSDDSSRQFSDEESYENFIVKDATSDFFLSCTENMIDCGFKYDLNSPEREPKLALLVLFENMNHTLLTALRTRNKRESGNGEKSLRYQGNENSNECSVDPFVVNFTEIYWDGWLMYPSSYHANICSGSCVSNMYDDTFVGHSIVKQSYKIYKDNYKRDKRFGVCCAPTEYKPLTLLYLNRHGNIVMKQIAKMSVSACGCV